MSQVRRAVAWCTTLTAAFSFTLFSSPAQAADPASQTTADAAVAWLKTQQQSDGGFELAMFPGFETRDASLAIAEDAQTGTTWSTTEALDALGALHFGGTPAGATPLDALDAFGATVTTAGAAAKTIVLTASPLGLDPSAFDPAGDGSPVNLVALLDSGCAADTASFGPAFSDTLYGVLAKKLVCGTPPPAALGGHPRRPAGERWLELQRRPDRHRRRPRHHRGRGRGPRGRWRRRLRPRGARRARLLRRQPAGQRCVAVVRHRRPQLHRRSPSSPSPPPASTCESSCWRDTADPGTAGSAYASPTAWLRSQQLTAPPADAGRIASPNDSFGVNTFATSQTVEGLLRSWLPITVAAAPTCAVPLTPLTPGSGAPAAAAEAVAVTPHFTG